MSHHTHNEEPPSPGCAVLVGVIAGFAMGVIWTLLILKVIG